MRNIGAIILLFVAWQLWGTSIGEHHAQDQLAAQFEAKVRTGTGVPKLASGSKTAKPGEVQLLPAPPVSRIRHWGAWWRALTIPKIGLNQYVVSGTAAAQLAEGPGHYVGTALPGQAGNVAIAGHRTTNGAPFNRLAELAPGDPIYLTTTWGEKLTYAVSQTPYAVSPSDVAVLDSFGDNRLTLTTCNPEFSVAQRLIVVAHLQQPTNVVPSKVVPHPYHLAPQSDPGWNWGELPVTLLLIGGLAVLALMNRRLGTLFGGFGRWAVLLPIWAGCLYLLFGALGQFLPASV